MLKFLTYSSVIVVFHAHVIVTGAEVVNSQTQKSPVNRVTDEPSFLFILGDDIGWADFHYNNGTAASPRISEWIKADGSITMQDFHTGGTVCSPTRATVLTGRNHFRDCVNYVYGCSDMTECVPDFEFAPQGTFTIGDAVRAANKNYTSHFGFVYALFGANDFDDSRTHTQSYIFFCCVCLLIWSYKTGANGILVLFTMTLTPSVADYLRQFHMDLVSNHE